MDDCQRVLSKHTAAARPNSWGGGSSPHIRRLAAGLPSPPGPQLCERNAKEAGVLQPRAHAHRGTRGSGRGKSLRSGVRLGAVPTLAPCKTWEFSQTPPPPSGLDVLTCEMERLNSVGSVTLHTEAAMETPDQWPNSQRPQGLLDNRGEAMVSMYWALTQCQEPGPGCSMCCLIPSSP